MGNEELNNFLNKEIDDIRKTDLQRDIESLFEDIERINLLYNKSFISLEEFSIIKDRIINSMIKNLEQLKSGYNT
jgi:hypothetical protein